MKLDTTKNRRLLSQLRTPAQEGNCWEISVRPEWPANHRKLRSTGNGDDGVSGHSSAGERRSVSGPTLESCVLEEAGQATCVLIGGRQSYTFYAVFPALSVLEGRQFRTVSAAERAVKTAMQELRRKGKAFCPRCGYVLTPADVGLR